MSRFLLWLYGDQPESEAVKSPDVLIEMRKRSLEALVDCGPDSVRLLRLRHQLAGAASAQQLWQLRGDIFQAIAQQHCEAEAARRLDGLLPLFEGWIPPSALRPLAYRPRTMH